MANRILAIKQTFQGCFNTSLLSVSSQVGSKALIDKNLKSKVRSALQDVSSGLEEAIESLV